MYENPWRVDDVARMQRERIQEEMREIRMVEAASRARSPRRSWAARLAAQLSLVVRKWLHGAEKSAQGLAAHPQVRLHPKSQARA